MSKCRSRVRRCRLSGSAWGGGPGGCAWAALWPRVGALVVKTGYWTVTANTTALASHVHFVHGRALYRPTDCGVEVARPAPDGATPDEPNGISQMNQMGWMQVDPVGPRWPPCRPLLAPMDSGWIRAYSWSCDPILLPPQPRSMAIRLELNHFRAIVELFDPKWINPNDKQTAHSDFSCPPPFYLFIVKPHTG